MKKCIHRIIFFISALILIAACSGNATPDKRGKEKPKSESRQQYDKFRIMEYCDTFPMDTFNRESPAMTIEISLPILDSDDERAKRINHYICCASLGCEPDNTIEDNINSYIEQCKADYYSNHSHYLNEKGINHSAAWLNYSYRINGKIIESRKGTICCEVDIITYQGGAHGTEDKVYITLDSASGYTFGLDDIFAEETTHTLVERLTTSLARQLGVGTLEEIHSKGYLTDIDLWPTTNIHLTDDSIYFHYCSYEIAPYALGSTTIALGYDQVKDIMLPTEKNN